MNLCRTPPVIKICEWGPWGYKDSAALLRLLINDYINGSGTAHHTQLHIKTFTHKKNTYAAAILESEKTLGTRLTKISPARVASGLQSTTVDKQTR